MMEWIHATIDYFQTRPDLQLVIRIHPAEIRGTVPSRQGVLTEIKKRWKKMPANVFVVQPEEQISTYTLMQQCDSVLIYGTKTGVELACSGIPLIVAGEAWIRNKGLTRDAGSPEEYRKLLSTLPLGSRHDAASQLRARRYAYHFFFRRMIPIEAVKPSTGTWPPFRIAINHLSELAEGVDPGLDVICKGVLDGTPFVYNGDASPSVPVSRPQEAK
jgi:capsule polysaccharide export protein KpsC/LpsZ